MVGGAGAGGEGAEDACEAISLRSVPETDADRTHRGPAFLARLRRRPYCEQVRKSPYIILHAEFFAGEIFVGSVRLRDSQLGCPYIFLCTSHDNYEMATDNELVMLQAAFEQRVRDAHEKGTVLPRLPIVLASC